VFTLASFRSPLLLAVLLGALAPAPETHSFDLTRDQKQNFTFAVDQPGKIVARVTWQGAPLAVSLVGPSGTVARQTGRGNVELVYAVTPADVSKGSAWRVALQSAARTGALIAVVAKGTVSIEHPAGDVQKLKSQLDAQNKQRLAQFRSQLLQRRLQSEAAVKGKLAQLQQAQEQTTRQAQATLLQHVAALRTRATAQPVRVSAADRQSGVRAAPVAGSGGNAGEPLSITSLSSSEGRPGDAILITGSGFGDGSAGAGTTVHIIVAPGKDIQFGTPDYHSDTQIQTSIPSDISGVTDNPNAAIYVKSAAGMSQLVPFHFKPAMATDFIDITRGDANVIDETDCDLADDVELPYVVHMGGMFCGGSGNDVWNRGRQLKNGWTVLSVDFGYKHIEPDADVFVSDSHVGTTDIGFTIHWWTSGGGIAGNPGMVTYSPVVFIQGPAGIPWK